MARAYLVFSSIRAGANKQCVLNTQHSTRSEWPASKGNNLNLANRLRWRKLENRLSRYLLQHYSEVFVYQSLLALHRNTLRPINHFNLFCGLWACLIEINFHINVMKLWRKEMFPFQIGSDYDVSNASKLTYLDAIVMHVETDGMALWLMKA